jgi:hypothetical protein
MLIIIYLSRIIIIKNNILLFRSIIVMWYAGMHVSIKLF